MSEIIVNYLKSLKTNLVGDGQVQEVKVEVEVEVEVEVLLWKDMNSKLNLVRNIEETRPYKWVLVFSSLLSETCYSVDAITL